MRKFRAMKECVQESIPDASIVDTKGRTKSFEVTVNGNLVYSKLDTGEFPEAGDIIKLIAGSVDKKPEIGVDTKPVDGSDAPFANGDREDEKPSKVKAVVKKEVVKTGKAATKRKAAVADAGTEKRVTRSRK